MGTFVQSITSIISLHFQLEKQLSFWIAGGLANTDWSTVKILIITGTVGSLSLYLFLILLLY
ncbi:hypothetical protein [Gracilibacillus sp. JCM 18860]|uniref:hypothetical protein n=1 Tax=Gracilibacillus sp. JCM 18860 TaxID=1306159 RepID=UPI003261B4C9